MFAKPSFIFLLFLLGLADGADEKTTEQKATETVDRLAVNLAGALVKSIFPEMDRGNTPAKVDAPMDSHASQEIRRAPSRMPSGMSQGQMLENIDNYRQQYSQSPAGQAFDSLSSLGTSFPNTNSMTNFGAGNGGLPSGLNPETVASMMSGVTENLSAGVGGAGAINALRKQKYLEDLQRHQSEMNRFALAQQEYLSANSKYQEQMMNQQAGAALLMQQQQQQYLNRMKNKYSGLPNAQPSVQPNSNAAVQALVTDPFQKPISDGLQGMEDRQTRGNVLDLAKDPVRQHAAKTAARAAFAEKNELGHRELLATDKNIKHLVKEMYGIDIPANGDLSQLSELQKTTLRDLKKYLVEQRSRVNSDKGVVDLMKEHRKDNVKQNRAGLEEEVVDLLNLGQKRSDDSDDSKETSKGADDEGEDGEMCEACIPIAMSKIKGPWTQIYGNPSVIKKTFATFLSLMNMKSIESGIVTSNLSPRTAACVGLEIGKTSKTSGRSKVNFFFRDDGEERSVHKMNGTLTLSKGVLGIDLDVVQNNYCLIKAGGNTPKNKYEYMILAETSGPYRCTAYHIFGRNTKQFNAKYFDTISEFMSSKVLVNGVRPVAPIPESEICQLE
uniref:Uncharacterized protein n=1 Tax=Rhabditophanes sp. KR3021 TaxID=114890 RepID=A0AC35UBA6_9BILA